MSKLLELIDRVAITQRDLDSLQDYLSNPPKDGKMGVSVNWTWGGISNPHAQALLKRRITQMIEEGFGVMCDTIFQEAKEEATQALNELKSYLEGPTRTMG